jgi:hypothetical protein
VLRQEAYVGIETILLIVVLVPRRGEICQREECDEMTVDSAHR